MDSLYCLRFPCLIVERGYFEEMHGSLGRFTDGLYRFTTCSMGNFKQKTKGVFYSLHLQWNWTCCWKSVFIKMETDVEQSMTHLISCEHVLNAICVR